jgi:histidinol-phosphate aminotransferase
MLNDLARKYVLDISPYQPGKPIREVQRELGLGDVIKLASNENPLGPSPRAVLAVKQALDEINRYPDGGCYYLKEKLASKLRVAKENLIIGNGSDEIIVLAVRAFLNEGEEVVIADPTFLIYGICVAAAGGKGVIVPQKSFKYDLPEMKKAITKRTKLVFIANPDNPVGSYVTKQEIAVFLDGIPGHLIVFIDEAYFEFAAEEEDYPDTMEYLSSSNLIITRTFSKAYGLCGLRVGYGISNPGLIDCMDRVREPFNVNSLAQAAAVAALDDDEHLRRTKKVVSEGKDYFYDNFRRMGLSYVPSAANFVLVDLGMNSTRVFKALLEEGIIVRDMKPWNMNNFIRVTVGTPRENKRFVSALEKVTGRGE